MSLFEGVLVRVEDMANKSTDMFIIFVCVREREERKKEKKEGAYG